jgi:hypothetical protein
MFDLSKKMGFESQVHDNKVEKTKA